MHRHLVVAGAAFAFVLLTVFITAAAQQATSQTSSVQTQSALFDVPLLNDVDGDQKADLIVWRPRTGTFHWLTSSSGFDYGKAGSKQWGSAGDVPLVGDLDGDGKADLVVWQPSRGEFHWLTSSSGYDERVSGSKQWGSPCGSPNVPLLADLDGDRKADLVVWCSGTGEFRWLTSSSGYKESAAGSTLFALAGWAATVPLLADLNGDGKADIIVWRPDAGEFHWRSSSDRFDDASGDTVETGLEGGVGCTGDVDGDGQKDLIIWASDTATFFWLTSSARYSYRSAGSTQFGDPGDRPLIGDIDGDGRADLALWEPGSEEFKWLTSSSRYSLVDSKQWGSGTAGLTAPAEGMSVDIENPSTVSGSGAGTWPKIRESGTMTFSDANVSSTAASFAAAALYVLQPSFSAATPIARTSSPAITMAANRPPVVSAGANQTITLPTSVNLRGSVTDDGLPSGGTLTQTWSAYTGPGSVTFGDVHALATTASFSVAGRYTLVLLATDGALTSSAVVVITVNGVAPLNQPPTVNAGSSQTISWPASATLAGSATDDGLPGAGPLLFTWSKVNGPGTVFFDNIHEARTVATFSATGTYILRLAASDGALSGTADVTVVLADPAPGTAFFVDGAIGNDNNNGLSPSTPWRTVNRVNLQAFSPGDSVSLKRGQVWRIGSSALIVNGSGTAAKPITLGAYGTGQRPEIRAVKEVTAWTQSGTNVWSAYVPAVDVKFVWEGDSRLQTRRQSSQALLSYGDWFYDSANSYLYVFKTSTPGTIEVTAFSAVVMLNERQHDIVFRDLNLSRSAGSIVQLRGAAGITFHNCEWAWAYKQGSSNWGNDAQADVVRNFVVEDSVIHDMGGAGVGLSGPVDGIAIKRNDVFGNCSLDDAGVFEHDDCGEIKIYGARNTNALIEGNDVHDGGFSGSNVHGVGIWVDTWGAAEAIVRFNRVHHTLYSGIVIENSEHESVYYNFVSGCSSSPTSNANPAFKAGIALYRGAQANLVANNTVAGCAYGVVIKGDSSPTSNNTVVNNISVNSTNQSLYVAAGEAEATASVFHNGFGPASVNFIYWNGRYYSAYGDWESSYRQTNSFEGDPGLMAPATGDLHLRSTSGARRAGIAVGLSSDIDGDQVPNDAVDIGADETSFTSVVSVVSRVPIK